MSASGEGALDEALFREAVARLERHSIPYWVDGGTLLGLVRDGRLIPWDTDFDFGVMRPDVTERDIFAAFEGRDFEVRSLLPSRGVHACHIHSRGRRTSGKVDITFYERVGDRAVHVAYAEPEDRWSVALDAVNSFLSPEHRSANLRERRLHRWCHESLAPRLPARARQELRRGFEGLQRRNCAAGKRLIYEYAARYFEGRERVWFLGVEVSVPLSVRELLVEAFGADWQTPRQFQRWYDGATRVEE